MINNIQIHKMQEADIEKAKEIWSKQYELYCSGDEFPSYWREETVLLEKFLLMKIKGEKALVAKLEDEVVGFLSYDEFPFNGEDSVFCPAIGHGAVQELKQSVYLSLYREASQNWVGRNILNHMWTVFYQDEELKSVLSNLGYGSYLIDAFNRCEEIKTKGCQCAITKATVEDAIDLYHLVKESNDYYASAPIFLVRDEYSIDEIRELITENNVFLAWDKEALVGYMHLSVSKGNNMIDMSVDRSGLIDEIGAYIKKEHRNKTIGAELLQHVNRYCLDKGICSMHVDFETANLYGDKFWRKYFNPMLLSMRRTINKNINFENNKADRS